MRLWLVILALPVLLWSAYWGAGAYTLKHGMESMLQDQHNGAVLSRYGDAQVGGFPTDFQVNMSDLELDRAESGFSWRISQIELRAPSYQPQNIQLDVSGEQRVETTLGALDLEARLFEINVSLRPTLDLPLGRAQLALEGAVVAHEQKGWLLGLERLMVDLRDVPSPDQAGSAPYQMTLAAKSLDLSDLGWNLPPSHQVMESLRARIGFAFSRAWDRSVLDQGFPRMDALMIHDIAMRIGDSEVTVTGQLERGSAGLMSGELLVDILNWRAILNILRQAGYIDPDIAGLIEDLMAGQDAAEDRVQLPITLEQGVISLGVFKLGFLSPLP